MIKEWPKYAFTKNGSFVRIHVPVKGSWSEQFYQDKGIAVDVVSYTAEPQIAFSYDRDGLFYLTGVEEYCLRSADVDGLAFLKPAVPEDIGAVEITVGETYESNEGKMVKIVGMISDPNNRPKHSRRYLGDNGLLFDDIGRNQPHSELKDGPWHTNLKRKV